MKATCSILLITLLFLFGSCEIEDGKGASYVSNYRNKVSENEVVDTIFYLKHFDDSIRICSARAIDTCKGTVILLPGWNYTFDHWIDSCDFLQTATKSGFNVIMPDVHKTIYANQIYPETRHDWSREVTRDWMNNTFLPLLHSMFKIKNHRLYVVGVSTGGRGALFLAMENQEWFKAGAAISGDFDQSAYPNDNLYIGFFGNKSEFPERYSGIENPLTQLIGFKIPFYFAHATDDQIVPVGHTQRLEEFLLTKNYGTNCEFHYSQSGGHNYTYWNKELTRILKFFESN